MGRINLLLFLFTVLNLLFEGGDMNIYIDPILIILYVLAIGSVMWYMLGCTWMRDWLRFKPSAIDISFEVKDARYLQLVIDILNYLEKNGSQFSKKKGSTIPIKDVISLINRNEVNNFRIMSLSNKDLYICVTCEFTDIKFRCTCDKETFDKLLKIMKEVNP